MREISRFCTPNTTSVGVGVRVVVRGHRYRSDYDVVQVRQGVGELVLGRVGGGLGYRQGGVGHDDSGGALQAVADPAQLKPRHPENAGRMLEGVPSAIHELGLDAVHQAAADAAHGSPQQHDDRG